MDSPSKPRDAAGAARRWRLIAITLWSAFLGALLILLTALALLPADLAGLGWTEFSIGFLCSWAIIAVPVTMALMLAAPLLEAPRGHGR